MITEFEDWSLIWRDKQIECRRQIGEPFNIRPNGRSSIQGNVLLIVGKDGWEFGKQWGDAEVRLSMNNPCGMSLETLESFVRVAKHARSLLENVRD